VLLLQFRGVAPGLRRRLGRSREGRWEVNRDFLCFLENILNSID
jgi:hypothetical protein